MDHPGSRTGHTSRRGGQHHQDPHHPILCTQISTDWWADSPSTDAQPALSPSAVAGAATRGTCAYSGSDHCRGGGGALRVQHDIALDQDGIARLVDAHAPSVRERAADAGRSLPGGRARAPVTWRLGDPDLLYRALASPLARPDRPHAAAEVPLTERSVGPNETAVGGAGLVTPPRDA